MKSQAVLLVVIVVCGVVLRWWQIDESFWVDELHTSWVVNSSLGDVATRASLGNQSPLYFWLAWFFARLPFEPELALRLPSLLAGGGLPVAVYWATRKFLPAEDDTEQQAKTVVAPLLAAALVAIDPLGIFYSQEARPYALLQLTTVLHFAFLLQIFDRPSWPARAGWVITGALLVHWHYTGALILIAECVSLVLVLMVESRGGGSQGCGVQQRDRLAFCSSCWFDLGILALLSLPAIPGMLDVAARRENWKQFVEPRPASEILWMFPWTPAIVLLIALHRWRSVISRRNLVLLAGWLLVPLTLAWVCTQADMAALFYKRYLMTAWPASLLTAALCVRLAKNWRVELALAMVVLMISLANGGLVQNWRQDGRLLHDRNEDWRGAIHALNAALVQGSPDSSVVLLQSGLIEADELPQREDSRLAEYCLYPLHGVYSLRPDVSAYPLTRTDSGTFLLHGARATLRAPNTRSFYLVGRGSAASRERTLQALRHSIAAGEDWSPQPPQTFGKVYLQQVIIRDR